MIWLTLALAADPVDEARTALAAQRPHTLLFHKESTGKPVLEVTTNGPREASATATSSEGEVRVSVDPAHVRVRLADGACAAIDVHAIYAAARHAALDLHTPEGPPGNQLVYWVTADGEVDLSSTWMADPDPPLFSWIDDLDAEGVSVTADETSFTAQGPGRSWVVDRATGTLRRMSVGDDALVWVRTTPAPNPNQALPALPRAADVCPTTTAKPLERMVTSQLRLAATLDPLEALAAAWTTLDEAARADALDRQRTWWRAFFADDLQGWIASLQGGTWKERVVADMADPAAFRAFREQLPPEARAQAVQHWQAAWFGRVGQDMLTEHVQEVSGALLQILEEAESPMPDELATQLLAGPMKQAALAEAEPLLQAVLVPVVEAGGAALQRALDAP